MQQLHDESVINSKFIVVSMFLPAQTPLTHMPKGSAVVVDGKVALAVTNATGDGNQKWFFWPLTANVHSPRTWEEVLFD